MSKIRCSNCGMNAIAMSNRKCPSCGHNLLGSDTFEKIGDIPEAASVSFRRVEGNVGGLKSEPTHFDLFWILFSFKGRLSRGMLGISVLLSTIISYFLLLLGALFSGDYPIFAVLYFVSVLLWFWSSIAISAKRIHDIGWPGWLVLFGLVPMLGPSLLCLTILSLKGKRGPNSYGLDPRRIWSAGMIDEIL